MSEYRSCTPMLDMLDPSVANSRILVKIRESHRASRDSAHSNKSNPRKPDPCDIAKHAATFPEAQLDSLRLPDERKHGKVHPTQAEA